mgnify:FL=1
MTTESTNDVTGAHGSSVQRMVSRVEWPEAKKKKHREYIKVWMKKNREKQNAYVRGFTKRNSASSATLANRKTWENATMAREPWSVLEDAMLFSAMTQGQLAKQLGRSIRAIQRRKWRLRQEEASNDPSSATATKAGGERKGNDE